MLKLKLVGDRAVALDFSRLSRSLPRKVLPEIVGKLTIAIEGRVITNLWGRLLNVRTGNLYKAPFSQFKNLGSGSYGIVGMRSNPSKDYQKIHEFGGMAGRNRSVKLKARGYMKKAFNYIVKLKSDKIIDTTMRKYIK